MKGKVIFITGATSGIGEGCARKFAAMGSNLILKVVPASLRRWAVT